MTVQQFVCMPKKHSFRSIHFVQFIQDINEKQHMYFSTILKYDTGKKLVKISSSKNIYSCVYTCISNPRYYI